MAAADPTRDSWIMPEADAPSDEVKTTTQVASTHTAREPTQLVSTFSHDYDNADHDDTASEFSGWSMLTPSAVSESGHNDEDTWEPGQQVQAHVDKEVEVDRASHDPELDVDSFDINIDACYDQQHVDNKPSSENDTKPSQIKRELASDQNKFFGIVVTFSQGVDADEGQKAVQLIGGYLKLALGPHAGKIRVESIEGKGCLQAPVGNLKIEDDHGELVVTIHRMNEERGQQDRADEDAPVETNKVCPSVDLEAAQIVSKVTAALLFHQTELAKAQTLRALLDSNDLSCSSDHFATSAQAVAKSSGTIASDDRPTLSQLIDIAKAKVHAELKAHENIDTFSNPGEKSAPQEMAKTKTKLSRGKVSARLNKDNFLIGAASALLLTVILLVLCMVNMSAKSHGHCVGLWLGS